MSLLLILSLAIVFGVLGRMLGGWLKPGGSTTWCRLVCWSIPVAVWGLVAFGPWGLLCGLGAYLGRLIPHTWWFGGPTVGDAVAMGLVGFARAALILSPCALLGHPEAMVFAPLGLVSGVAYWVGWHWMESVKSPITIPSFTWRGVLVDGGNFAESGTGWAEFLTGADFGLMMGGCLCLLTL